MIEQFWSAKGKKEPRKWCKSKRVLNLLTNTNQTWRLRAASPLWQSESGEPFPPPEGTPEVARAADQAIHLKTHSWEAGTRVAAALWYTLHQSPPLLPIIGTHITLMSGCFCLIGYIKIKAKLLTIEAFAANKIKKLFFQSRWCNVNIWKAGKPTTEKSLWYSYASKTVQKQRLLKKKSLFKIETFLDLLSSLRLCFHTY